MTPTRANGLPALAFTRDEDGTGAPRPHARALRAGRAAELTVFVGADLVAGF